MHKIESNVEIPANGKGYWQRIAKDMKVGDSVQTDKPNQASLLRRALGGKGKALVKNNRVWRIS